MPTFKYTAKKLSGKTVRGRADAADTAALVASLRSSGLYLISSREDARQDRIPKMSSKELSQFNRELGAMLSSGVTLIRSIEIILRRDLTPRQRRVYQGLYHSLITGHALSEAMENSGGAFPELLINMYRAAEANGTMDVAADRMADHYEKDYRLQNKLRSAATYPIILLCLTVIIMVVVFTVVLPNFMSLYSDGDLPGITRALIAISKLFTDDFLYLIIGVLVLVLLISQVVRLKPVRIFLDRAKVHLPLIGHLNRIICTSRFARTLSSLYSSGIPILSVLQISRGTLGNAYIESQLDSVIRDVRNGSALSSALDRVDGYDKKLSSTVLVGEEAGQLEKMLLSVSDSFDYEAEQASQRLVTILEPVMIIIMGIIIGIVVIGVMLPIFNMYQSLGL